MTKTWAERFESMSHEDRVMTIVEDGSTLDALIAEARQSPLVAAGKPGPFNDAESLDLNDEPTGDGTGDIS